MLISVPPETKKIPVEISKKCEIFFEKEGKVFLIGGKIFSQGIERMLFLPETDILEEKRKNERYLVSLLPVKLKAKLGIFHREEIVGNIINISLGGFKIETNIPLRENIIYEVETTFYIKRKPHPFSAQANLKYIQKVENIYISGINFVKIDFISYENLRKYIKNLKHELGKDKLNY